MKRKILTSHSSRLASSQKKSREKHACSRSTCFVRSYECIWVFFIDRSNYFSSREVIFMIIPWYFNIPLPRLLFRPWFSHVEGKRTLPHEPGFYGNTCWDMWPVSVYICGQRTAWHYFVSKCAKVVLPACFWWSQPYPWLQSDCHHIPKLPFVFPFRLTI